MADIYTHIEDIPAELRPTAVALGNFDGFHLGHQRVVGEAVGIARALGIRSAVVVTEPHPVSFFRPDLPPFRLTPASERATLLKKFGVDIILSLPFDKDLASMSAQDFVLGILCRGLGAQHIAVGYDYRFGRGRGGSVDVLRWMGDMEGFATRVIEPVTIGGDAAGQAYSSTLVRRAIAAGDVWQAARMLGHWWGISGRVETGDKRGRTIGFPTANIDIAGALIPAFGVYAVRLLLPGGEESGPANHAEPATRVHAGVYEGVANLGMRPTFDKKTPILEVHVFDFEGDLYGQDVRVEFVDFIRAEQRFDGLPALKAQIADDCDSARTLLRMPVHARDRLRPPRFEPALHAPDLAFPAATASAPPNTAQP